MNRFIADKKLYNIFQIAFRQIHSTETALQQILNNIYSTLSPSISCQLILLDILCAFDSLNHSILISILEMIGICGTVIKWFSSYILNRSSSVKIFNFSTKSSPLNYGVPQRSVLGPILLSIYILPIHDIIGQFPDVHYHIYADDIQLYSFLPKSSNELLDNSQLSKCASTIRSWLLSNNLLLNSSKSALLNIPSNYNYFPLVIIDDLPIIPSSYIINIGVTLDANLFLNSYIANISKSANYHLYTIRRIRKDLLALLPLSS